MRTPLSLTPVLIMVLASSTSLAQQPLPVPRRLLIFAPHPDDVMLAAGLAQRVVASGGAVRVVDMTCGDARSPGGQAFLERQGFHQSDNPGINYGLWRQREDRAALGGLGLPAGTAVWLGYPDGGCWEILRRGRAGDARPVVSRSTGVSAVPYASAASPGAPYLLASIIAELARELAAFRPEMMIVMHPNDNHPDHAATWWIGAEALRRSGLDAAQVAVRVPLDVYGVRLPLRLTPGLVLRPPGYLPSPTRWFELNLTPAELAAKVKLIGAYPSQMTWEHPTQATPSGTSSYMYGYAATNEVFGEVLEAHHDEAFRRLVNARELARRALGVARNVVDDEIGAIAR